VPAEQPTSATAALAALASRLGVEELPDLGEMVAGLFDQLRQRDRWLLVYDNAERPDRLAGLLPPGGGGRCWGCVPRSGGIEGVVVNLGEDV
jgi:hypothetical protein